MPPRTNSSHDASLKTDTRDHCHDGYAVENAEEFFDTWRDYCALPADQNIQQFIAAWPKDR